MCLDDESNKNTVLRFNQTLQNYLKVSFGKDTYNPTSCGEIQIIDVTEVRYSIKGDSVLPKWRIKNLSSYIN